MELKEYIKILKTNIFLILLFAVLGASLAFFFAAKFEKDRSYQQIFFITAPSETEEVGFSFEGFYSSEKARNFTDTAIAVILTPDFAAEVAPVKITSVRKIAPQVIRLSAQAENQSEAKEALTDAKDIFNQKIIDLTGFESFQLKPVGNMVTPQTAKFSKNALVAFGALAGLIFALVTVGAKTYFKV